MSPGDNHLRYWLITINFSLCICYTLFALAWVKAIWYELLIGRVMARDWPLRLAWAVQSLSAHKHIILINEQGILNETHMSTANITEVSLWYWIMTMSIRNDGSLRCYIDKRKCISSYQRQVRDIGTQQWTASYKYYIFVEIGTNFTTNGEQ